MSQWQQPREILLWVMLLLDMQQRLCERHPALGSSCGLQLPPGARVRLAILHAPRMPMGFKIEDKNGSRH
jgi:hypothetical protein